MEDARLRAIVAATRTWRVWLRSVPDIQFDGGLVHVEAHRVFTDDAGAICFEKFRYSGNPREGIRPTLPYMWSRDVWVGCVEIIDPKSDRTIL